MSLTYMIFGIPQTIDDFVKQMKKDKKTDVNLEFKVDKDIEGNWHYISANYNISGGLISSRVIIDRFEERTYFANFFGEDELKWQAISNAEVLAKELKRKYGFDVSINGESLEKLKEKIETAYNRAAGTAYASLVLVR